VQVGLFFPSVAICNMVPEHYCRWGDPALTHLLLLRIKGFFLLRCRENDNSCGSTTTYASLQKALVRVTLKEDHP
jgi:hypothetical protein